MEEFQGGAVKRPDLGIPISYIIYSLRSYDLKSNKMIPRIRSFYQYAKQIHFALGCYFGYSYLWKTAREATRDVL